VNDDNNIKYTRSYNKLRPHNNVNMSC